jgi:hypothetical protein
LASVTSQESPCQRNSITAMITRSTTGQLLTSRDPSPLAAPPQGSAVHARLRSGADPASVRSLSRS